VRAVLRFCSPSVAKSSICVRADLLFQKYPAAPRAPNATAPAPIPAAIGDPPFPVPLLLVVFESTTIVGLIDASVVKIVDDFGSGEGIFVFEVLEV